MTMTQVQTQVNLLRREVDFLTQEIQKKLYEGQFLDLAAMVDLRFRLIKRLMNFFSQDIDKVALKNYFTELYERDQAIITKICQENLTIEAALLKLNKVSHYSEPAVRGG